MSEAPDRVLRKTALYPCHLEAGGRMVPFAGYELPVQYSGVVEEHKAVRERAGLFDVSHMGEFLVEGADACVFLQRVTPNNVARLEVGQAHYSALLNEDATFLDDLLVYRLAEQRYMLVVNAAGRTGDFERLAGQLNEGGEDATLEDQSDATALLALQGPKAPEILATLTDLALDDVRYYRFARADVAGIEMIVSRTGYTGEDGFELYVDQDRAVELWGALVSAGEPHGLQPAGLGARYPAPRGRDDVERPGHRLRHDAARGRTRLDREVEEGRLFWPRGPGGAA